MKHVTVRRGTPWSRACFSITATGEERGTVDLTCAGLARITFRVHALDMSNRIGPQMARAAALVGSNPGTAILPIAKSLHIGARRGTDNSLGYNPVHRAINAGLIVNVPAQSRGNGYALYTPEQIDALRGLDSLRF